MWLRHEFALKQRGAAKRASGRRTKESIDIESVLCTIAHISRVAVQQRRDNIRRIWTLLRGKRGQGLVEYALILVLVAIVVIAALTVFGQKTANTLSNITNQLP